MVAILTIGAGGVSGSRRSGAAQLDELLDPQAAGVSGAGAAVRRCAALAAQVQVGFLVGLVDLTQVALLQLRIEGRRGQQPTGCRRCCRGGRRVPAGPASDGRAARRWPAALRRRPAWRSRPAAGRPGRAAEGAFHFQGGSWLGTLWVTVGKGRRSVPPGNSARKHGRTAPRRHSGDGRMPHGHQAGTASWPSMPSRKPATAPSGGAQWRCRGTCGAMSWNTE